MKKGNSSEELTEGDDGSDWLTTYADLMTLLLVFFVLLFSLSTFKVEKFEKLLKSIRVNPGMGQPTSSLIEFMELPEAIDKELSIEQFIGLKRKKTNQPGVEQKEEEILDDINQFITQKRLGKHIALEILDGKIIIRVRGKVLFRSGKANLSRSAEPILDEITSVINAYEEYNVNIKGHTDNVPISTRKFESNWDLSAIRATAVLKYLIRNGVPPKRLTATGFGELFPIVPNNSAKNKAINRRVEFVLEKDNQ